MALLFAFKHNAIGFLTQYIDRRAKMISLFCEYMRKYIHFLVNCVESPC